VPRHVRLRELLVGVEGLALLRHLYDGGDDAARARLAEIRRVLEDDAFSVEEPVDEADIRAGYCAWAESYDESSNPMVALEEPVVATLLDSLPSGRALDAACGTGRHARLLVDRDHDVLGVDLSAEMLGRAAVKVPEARFMEGDLRAIPAPAEKFDVVVCGLALAHVPDLADCISELARVLRPDGHLIVSVLHPLQVHLGWHARFADPSGQRSFVREHPHTHADYLDGFTTAGLSLRSCSEPRLAAEHIRQLKRAFRHIPEATLHAYTGLPGVLVWHVEKK
jgi:SAM-dependent methyltransferase